MKALFYIREPEEETLIRQMLPGIEVICRKGSFADGPPGPESDIEILSVFVDNPIGPEEFTRFPNLKLIAARSVGVDHIDMAAAKAHGVAITNVPGYGAPTVAEFVFALILGLSRRLCEARELVRREHKLSQKGLDGFDLSGKTIGIVGCGRIGSHVAEIAAGFGMHILAFDERQDEKLAARTGLRWVSLPELLANSDIVTLHVPATEETHYLINAKTLAQTKKGAYLINTARGSVVDASALVAALESGWLAGAGIDVLEDEGETLDEAKLLTGPPLPAEESRTMLANEYLCAHPQVIVTPHIAFDTHEAPGRILDTTIKNITMFLDNSPQNIINGAH